MGFLSKLFNTNSDEFREVRVDREVLESVIYYAKKAYPNEFLAFFDGKIKDKILYITSLIFLPGETCDVGAVVHTEMLPPTLKYWGSVHSHPGPSAQPSGADLKTFSKNGLFHMIVCLPYSLETFMAYDKYGQPISYTVGDYADEIDGDISEFFDEDDVLKDGEEVKPGFFDDEDDFDLEDEDIDQDYREYEMMAQNNNPTIISNIELPPLSDGDNIQIELDENGNIKRIYKLPKDD